MKVAVPIALCMAVAVLEGFDIQAMGVAAPRLAPEFGLGAREMGWVFAINNIGMVLGAALGGWLADRVGRKPVLIGAVAMFGVFTLVRRVHARRSRRCSPCACSRGWGSAPRCPT